MPRSRAFFSSYRWQVAFAYLVVIIVAFITINISILEILDRHLVGNKKDSFSLYANWVAQSIVYNYASEDPDVLANVAFDIQEMGEEIFAREQESTRILVVNSNGVVDFDSFNILAGPDSLLRRNMTLDFPEIADILAGRSIEPRVLYISPHNYPFPRRVIYVYAPIYHESYGVIGAILISTSLSDLQELITDVGRSLIVFSFFVVVIVFVVSALLSGYITRPIKQLTDAISGMSQGRMGQRINIRAGGEIKELAEAFNMMSEKLENLDKTRNQFVSNASHELRTPLSAIKVLTESLIHMDVRDFAIYNEFLSDINDEIDRLNAIINDLLTLVQIDTKGLRLKRETIDIVDLVKETIHGLRPLAYKKGVQLEINCADAHRVDGDEIKLGQVISNIVDNAIKYTPEGGMVMVHVNSADGKVTIKVTDTGVGIPQQDIPYIFDRFYRVDKARSRTTGGTGLGLSIAQEIVLLHGGTIRVESIENEGSTFYLELISNRQ